MVNEGAEERKTLFEMRNYGKHLLATISTRSSSAHVEERRAHSQTRKHWGRECSMRLQYFTPLVPQVFLSLGV